MPEEDPLTTAETFLRARAMNYPEATEDFSFGHRAIEVKAKRFLVLDRTNGVLSVAMKLPDSSAYALLQRYAEPHGSGQDRSDWVSCRFNPGDELPLDLLEEWIEESYRAVAPKKLILALNAREAGDPEPPPAKPKRGPKKGKAKGK